MKKRLLLVVLACVASASLAAQTPEPVDTAAIAKIRAEGLQKSQIMETMFWLTDRYGPRTHHTNMDFLDRVQPDDMKQMSTVAAVLSWQAANRDQMLPRK